MKPESLIREALLDAVQTGYPKLCSGSWLIRSKGAITHADPICLTLLAHNKLPSQDPSSPGIIEAACALLDVDHHWIYRFAIGFDVGNQILIEYTDKTSKQTKYATDQVCLFGKQLRSEYLHLL